MNEQTVRQLNPTDVWKEFAAISDIPRGSGNEAAIIAYITERANKLSLEHRQDKAGNLLVRLGATPGCEKTPGLILQGHVDMVCEKDSHTVHDFTVDPIRLVVDGDWLRADHTTLGADNGIAVAMMLALMQGNYAHGPVDLLFTIDEESGLTGAMNLEPAMLNFRSLINIDGEEEGFFYIGCAGGKETLGTLPLQFKPRRAGDSVVTLTLAGLKGGHSGADIHLQPGNALKLLARFLWMEQANFGFQIIDFNGGDKHNAICREAFCTIAIASETVGKLKVAVARWEAIFQTELGPSEPALTFTVVSSKDITDSNQNTLVLTETSQANFINLIYTIPHGVLSMSRTMPGLVSTSTNLAAVKFHNKQAELVTNQRSDIQSQMEDAAQLVRAHLIANGSNFQFSREYPSWTPQPDSPLLARMLASYRRLNRGTTPVVASIHAGMECGVIGSRQSGMDMVSFGPDIRGAHTPQEKVHIDSTARTWLFLLNFLGEH